MSLKGEEREEALSWKLIFPAFFRPFLWDGVPRGNRARTRIPRPLEAHPRGPLDPTLAFSLSPLRPTVSCASRVEALPPPPPERRRPSAVTPSLRRPPSPPRYLLRVLPVQRRRLPLRPALLIRLPVQPPRRHRPSSAQTRFLCRRQNEAQLYQDGIQECRFLKSKILGAEQMKDACLPTATSINASDRQEELAILTEKQLELNNIQQKVEHLRSSLDCFCNIEGDISCDSVMRHAEEQLKTRNQCPFIHRQARDPQCIVLSLFGKSDILLLSSLIQAQI
ncbi:uncharacterized protein LOC120662683 [Panicum virgatum]|uniref:uncharacterized protein LOC120662683 n=1 Tax=Panicum virgatum TaxID=38727 RepID=UPI0019D6130C|nr:uncharacterized protein LOC120662683 [Panicum virgatum]